ncbi:MAG: DMT family transporter [Eggerthellaceae bacterium]
MKSADIENRLPGWAYKALIVFATIIWGYSFVVMKDVVEVLPPAWLLGIRFTSAGLILLAVLWKRVRRTFTGKVLAAGALLGVFDFAAFWTQTVGLQHTTPGINAFLTATYCVIVPFLWWIIARKRPTVFNVGAAVLAVAGIWLVSVTGSGAALSMGFGEGMTLLCALLFALHMVLVSEFSRRRRAGAHRVPVLAEGLLGCLTGACFEALPPLAAITPGIGVQHGVPHGVRLHRGVRHSEPRAGARAARPGFCSQPESVFGVLFSVAVRRAAHRALVLGSPHFIAIVISETFPLKRTVAAEAPPEEADGAAVLRAGSAATPETAPGRAE